MNAFSNPKDKHGNNSVKSTCINLFINHRQTGSPTSAIQLGTYKFQNTLKCNSTDDGTNYTITSDKPNVGYQFKINKSTGLSKSFQDIEGNNAYAQVIFDRAHPGGAGNVDEAATVSAPSTQLYDIILWNSTITSGIISGYTMLGDNTMANTRNFKKRKRY